MNAFKIEFLDHVAIRVADLKVSADWYEKVLGLKKYQFKEWGTFPVFLLAGKTGLALFPDKAEGSSLSSTFKNIKIDHFAFNVTERNFQKAKKHFDELGIKYNWQDHHFFHSIYIKDPDGHTVELTTIVVDEDDFYL